MSQIENLKVTFDHFSLDIPQWELSDHGITCLMGESGAGKSTVLNVLSGLILCKPMSWIVDGVDIQTLAQKNKRLGVVFQSLDVFPHMTARQNICFLARARGCSKLQANQQCEELGDFLGINHRLDANCLTLSGGERQRVALASAVIGGPRYLLLDEPFSALDENNRAAARRLLKELVGKHNIPTLLVTHSQEDQRELADSTFYIKKGKLVGV